jgi:hypothetical protein
VRSAAPNACGSPEGNALWQVGVAVVRQLPTCKEELLSLYETIRFMDFSLYFILSENIGYKMARQFSETIHDILEINPEKK